MFKEDWEDWGHKQWTRDSIPNIFVLYCSLLKLRNPDSAQGSLPGDASHKKSLWVQ